MFGELKINLEHWKMRENVECRELREKWKRNEEKKSEDLRIKCMQYNDRLIYGEIYSIQQDISHASD